MRYICIFIIITDMYIQTTTHVNFIFIDTAADLEITAILRTRKHSLAHV